MLILLTYFSFHQLSLLRKLHGALRKLSDLWRNHSSFITPASLLEQDGNTTCPLLSLSLWIWQQLEETVWRHFKSPILLYPGFGWMVSCYKFSDATSNCYAPYKDFLEVFQQWIFSDVWSIIRNNIFCYWDCSTFNINAVFR